MGVGGNFWDLLRPYGRLEGPDFLRGCRVAVDLSFWIVAHTAAVRARSPGARCPHLRSTFFRTVNLFAKMGAFPVFVVDGSPSPLKTRARIRRFFRGSGLDPSELAAMEAEADQVKGRNRAFDMQVAECLELLDLLKMPVVRARCEAEALCAQLNAEGEVEACITSDSDAFLFGAKCVIKNLRSNCKEPFECYNISDVEAGTGLKRKQLVAMALLVGSDHDLQGVPGFGLDTALRFVKLFKEDEILDRLREIGRGVFPVSERFNLADVGINDASCSRSSHCSNCGHPGTKAGHRKAPCCYCSQHQSKNCAKKLPGFECACPQCDKVRRIKDQKKHEDWQMKVHARIAAEKNFPNDDIINMYLSDNNYDSKTRLVWEEEPLVEFLVDFLAYKQGWDPSYVRRMLLPMMTTIYLRKKAAYPSDASLLLGQYHFHSIKRVKIRFGHPLYLVRWMRASSQTINSSRELDAPQQPEPDEDGDGEPTDLSDEPHVAQFTVEDGVTVMLTEENIDLVHAAFPNEAKLFQEEHQRRKGAASKGKGSSESPDSNRVQLSIKEFYRAVKAANHEKVEEKNSPTAGRKRSADPDENLPKSVRRQLLFD